MPGLLRPIDGIPDGPSPTRLRLTTAQELDAIWPARRATRSAELFNADGRRILTIDYEPATGYRVWVPRGGRYLISPDGLDILCAPQRARAGHWRLLIGQALPIASALRGYEVLHASAVEVDGQAIAFTAPSGVGKTSLALRMVLTGARLMADDHVALEAAEGGVRAYAGAGIANVPLEQAAAMSEAELARLGEVVDESHKLHLAFETDGRPVPLSRIYFLGREAGTGSGDDRAHRPAGPDAPARLHVRVPRRDSQST